MSDQNEQLRAEFDEYIAKALPNWRDPTATERHRQGRNVGQYFYQHVQVAWDAVQWLEARRAPPAAPAPVAAIKTWQERRATSINQDEAMRDEIADLRAALATLPAAAPIVQPVGDEQAPLYDLSADKDFAEDFARLAEGIPHIKTRKLVIKAVKQAIAAHGAAERERGRREARAALAAPTTNTADAKDAARYRYLRDTATLETAVWEALEGHGSTDEDGNLDAAGYRAGFDQAIDKARAAIATSTDEVKRGAK